MLSAFATINQKIMIFDLKHLGGVIPALKRATGAGTEGGELHSLHIQNFCYGYPETSQYAGCNRFFLFKNTNRH